MNKNEADSKQSMLPLKTRSYIHKRKMCIHCWFCRILGHYNLLNNNLQSRLARLHNYQTLLKNTHHCNNDTKYSVDTGGINSLPCFGHLHKSLDSCNSMSALIRKPYWIQQDRSQNRTSRHIHVHPGI